MKSCCVLGNFAFLRGCLCFVIEDIFGILYHSSNATENGDIYFNFIGGHQMHAAFQAYDSDSR